MKTIFFITTNNATIYIKNDSKNILTELLNVIILKIVSQHFLMLSLGKLAMIS